MDAKAFASKARMSRSTVANYEDPGYSGRRNPHYVTAWATAANCDEQWLMTGQAGPDDGPGLTLVAGTGFEPVTSGSHGADEAGEVFAPEGVEPLGGTVVPLRVRRPAPIETPDRISA